jgi:Clp amino terminal domain, pathogenicity island component
MHRAQLGDCPSDCCAGVDTLLIAVLNSPEIASALEEAGISAKQMAASVEELRGSSAKV